MNKDHSGVSDLVTEDQFRELRFNLLHTCSWVSNSIRQFLQPFEITPKQYSILRILHDCAPQSLSIQEIRERLADRMSDASRLVDRLEKKQLIDKFPSEKDRRSNRASISARGEQLLLKVDRDRQQLDAQIGDRLTYDEIDQLNGLLDRLK